MSRWEEEEMVEEFLNAFYLPGAILNALRILTHLTLMRREVDVITPVL